jgi:squalene synthase HpnC
VVTDPVLASAYQHCVRLARDHYENFPVASRLLPGPMRPHIAAIYAFARTADDFADEPGLARDERLNRLDDWLDRLRRAAADASGSGGPTSSDDLVFVALAATIREHQLPVSLFEDLLSAFRQDVTRTRYDTWSELLDYCRRSANAVGRLVLRVGGYVDSGLDAASDAVCTALQLTNFWQDLERDWRIGRVYVPREDLERAGAREEDLASGRITPEWQRVMADMVERTRPIFARGRPVCDGVRGRLRWELRLTWLGGSRILDSIARANYDVIGHRPTLSAADVPALLWQALLWNRIPGA